jgi:hypothetical protein
MTRASSRRAAQHERDTARALGSVRTARRGSYRREPDLAPIVARGLRLAPECKVRSTLRTLLSWLQQAEGYQPGAAPLVIARDGAGEQIAIMRLDHWLVLAGLDGAQLPTRHRPTRREPRQTTWGWAHE